MDVQIVNLNMLEHGILHIRLSAATGYRTVQKFLYRHHHALFAPRRGAKERAGEMQERYTFLASLYEVMEGNGVVIGDDTRTAANLIVKVTIISPTATRHQTLAKQFAPQTCSRTVLLAFVETGRLLSFLRLLRYTGLYILRTEKSKHVHIGERLKGISTRRRLTPFLLICGSYESNFTPKSRWWKAYTTKNTKNSARNLASRLQV